MAKDLYHDVVKKALINEGWTVTHDPYPLKIGSVRMFIDLGAERIIAAEKGNPYYGKGKNIPENFAVFFRGLF
jgi:hypothetical protein